MVKVATTLGRTMNYLGNPDKLGHGRAPKIIKGQIQVNRDSEEGGLSGDSEEVDMSVYDIGMVLTWLRSEKTKVKKEKKRR